MLVPLPNLDDRRWSELVEEGRALIPVYDQTWSDHNIHDPGIMLMELLAWVAEMDIYWLNRIPESRLRKFLALAGFTPAPPQPAWAILQILLQDGAPPVSLPPGIVFDGVDALNQTVPFQTMQPVTLAPGNLTAVLRQQEGVWADLTGGHNRREPFAPFGNDPGIGAAFYLGFSQPIPADEPVSLGFTLAGDRVDADERQRLVEWLARHSQACHPPEDLVDCCPDGEDGDETPLAEPLQHHSIRLDWEYLDSNIEWQTLEPQAGRVWDDTRALTLNGRVVVRVPGEMLNHPLGEPERHLYWLRCRITGGAYDAPPSISSLAFNAAIVAQAANLGTQTWMIASDAQVEGTPPEPGDPVGLAGLEFSPSGWITHLTFSTDAPPGYRLLAYQSPHDDQPGQLSLGAEALDLGNGKPSQVRPLATAPTDAESLSLYTLENGSWVRWAAAADLDAAGPADAQFVLDATLGEIRFGDGVRGRALPHGALPLASYETTRAEAGNLPAGTIKSLPDIIQNRVLVDDLAAIASAIASISNPQPASGGAAAETTDDTSARLLATLDTPQRAVTLDDTRWLSFQTPGVRLARVAAIANVHPAYPCMKAPGIVTVIVLPGLPEGRPQPSAGLLGAVRAYLAPRRVLGTRLIVTGPRYAELSVQARVQAGVGVSLTEVRDRIVAALDRFFDPLIGGPSGDGWPFGRDIYRTEVLQVIDETPGVDHVLSLELIGDCGEPGCGNLCIGPLSLVAAGQHQIEVQ